MAFKPLIKLTGHNGAVYDLVDGGEDYFYSVSGDGFIVQWHKNALNPDGKLVAKNDAALYCGCCTLANKIVVGSIEGNVLWIDVFENKIIHNSQAHTKAVYALIDFDNYILSCGGDGKLIWHEKKSMLPELIMQVSRSSLRCMCIDSIKKKLYIGSSDSHVYVINLEKRSVETRYKLHDSSIFSIMYNEGKIYSGSRDAKMKIWQAHDFKNIATIDAHLATINSIILLEDLLVTASRDKTIKIWDLDGKLVQTIYSFEGGHINSVNKVLALDWETRFVSGSDDRSLVVFDESVC